MATQEPQLFVWAVLSFSTNMEEGRFSLSRKEKGFSKDKHSFFSFSGCLTLVPRLWHGEDQKLRGRLISTKVRRKLMFLEIQRQQSMGGEWHCSQRFLGFCTAWQSCLWAILFTENRRVASLLLISFGSEWCTCLLGEWPMCERSHPNISRTKNGGNNSFFLKTRDQGRQLM